MIWLGIGLVALALALAYGVRTWAEVQRSRDSEPEAGFREWTGQGRPRGKTPEERQEEEDAATVAMIREGPRDYDARQEEGWRQEMRDSGLAEPAIESILRNREPIFQL